MKKRRILFIALLAVIGIFAWIDLHPSVPQPAQQVMTPAEAAQAGFNDAQDAPSISSISRRGTVAIGGRKFVALISADDASRELGLGNRDKLPEGQAMLFVFDTPDLIGFWMKDMRFSIDMLWLDESYRVVWLEKSVAPETYPKTYFPSKPAKYVIETNAGILQSLGTKIGDKVEVSEFPQQ